MNDNVFENKLMSNSSFIFVHERQGVTTDWAEMCDKLHALATLPPLKKSPISLERILHTLSRYGGEEKNVRPC
jgi:hypothetical protein